MEVFGTNFLRDDLEKVNDQFFSFLELRRDLVKRIQKSKNLEWEKDFPYFDAAREIVFFAQMGEKLTNLSYKELYAFSLLIEDHALLGDDVFELYPMWSRKVHIDQSRAHFFSEGNTDKEMLVRINPILIYFHSHDIFASLPFNEQFSYLEKLLYTA